MKAILFEPEELHQSEFFEHVGNFIYVDVYSHGERSYTTTSYYFASCCYILLYQLSIMLRIPLHMFNLP